jgi:hypothetical protein
MRKIAELKNLLPQRDSAWNSYIEVNARCKAISQVLRQYVKCGVIDKTDIPRSEKTHFVVKVKESRK